MFRRWEGIPGDNTDFTTKQMGSHRPTANVSVSVTVIYVSSGQKTILFFLHLEQNFAKYWNMEWI